jgi:hypothetical protein
LSGFKFVPVHKTIVLPWGEKEIRHKMFGGGYTQLNEGVGEIINGKAGFLKLNEIKKAYRVFQVLNTCSSISLYVISTPFLTLELIIASILVNSLSFISWPFENFFYEVEETTFKTKEDAIKFLRESEGNDFYTKSELLEIE